MKLTSYFCIISIGRTKRNIHGSEERNPQNPKRQIHSAHLQNPTEYKNTKNTRQIKRKKCTKPKINPQK